MVGWLDGWLFGYLVIWLFGYLVIWLFGYLVIWCSILVLKHVRFQAVLAANRRKPGWGA